MGKMPRRHFPFPISPCRNGSDMAMTPWPRLILRLTSRGIDIRAELGVSRMTVWRWRNGTIPDTPYAIRLLQLDGQAVDGQPVDENKVEVVTP